MIFNVIFCATLLIYNYVMDKWNIYVLELAENKYYVGKTKKPKNRLYEHFNGGGAIWTKKYPPVKLINFIDNCSSFDEDKYTLQYMNIHGIENVRGGSYSQIKLDEHTIAYIQKQLISANNLCYKCMQSDHFAKDCILYVVKETVCFNCKKSGHLSKNCIMNIICHNCHKMGHISKDCTNEKNCYRCGKIGHCSYECHSTTHINGTRL